MQWDKRAAVQQFRFKRLAEDLVRESAVWITKDNLDSKITTDLFSKPAATTGIHTRYSNHWRYNAISYNHEIARALEPEKFLADESTAASRLSSAFGQQSFYRRQDMEDFLTPMVNSGAERAQLPGLVDEYLKAMQKLEDPEEQLMMDQVGDRCDGCGTC